MDIFVVWKPHSCGAVDQTGPCPVVGELCRRLATRISLYKRCSARVLSGDCGLDGAGKLPLFRGSVLLDYLRSSADGGAGHELPSDRGIAVRWGSIGRVLRGF